MANAGHLVRRTSQREMVVPQKSLERMEMRDMRNRLVQENGGPAYGTINQGFEDPQSQFPSSLLPSLHSFPSSLLPSLHSFPFSLLPSLYSSPSHYSPPFTPSPPHYSPPFTLPLHTTPFSS
ncbi:hypothetical protein Pcinc_002335 [Petrolisthes cinctipes]|uniref:Uncharacterized protein n=1 Tax=Petrolisthes cinctipes TaxID=88211 RepID=A0AAE1GL77_PETCI|nr:hypothetical protein Pcinc_002335 [Petrolisthes cinctipes]